MTAFDFEILEAVAKFGDKGVTITELQNAYFPAYDLTYNLQKLSDDKPINAYGIRILFANANVLYETKEYLDEKHFVYKSRYFITERGKVLLANWQRQQRKARKQHVIESILLALLGAIFGTILGQFAGDFLTELLPLIKGHFVTSNLILPLSIKYIKAFVILSASIS